MASGSVETDHITMGWQSLWNVCFGPTIMCYVFRIFGSHFYYQILHGSGNDKSSNGIGHVSYTSTTKKIVPKRGRPYWSLLISFQKSLDWFHWMKKGHDTRKFSKKDSTKKFGSCCACTHLLAGVRTRKTVNFVKNSKLLDVGGARHRAVNYGSDAKNRR